MEHLVQDLMEDIEKYKGEKSPYLNDASLALANFQKAHPKYRMSVAEWNKRFKEILSETKRHAQVPFDQFLLRGPVHYKSRLKHRHPYLWKHNVTKSKTSIYVSQCSGHEKSAR